MKGFLHDLLRACLPGLSSGCDGAAGRPDADDGLSDPASAVDLADVRSEVDLSFGMREEAGALVDAVSESAGLGPVSGMEMDASSARMSALQIQKQLAAESVNIVNSVPHSLLGLLT